MQDANQRDPRRCKNLNKKEYIMCHWNSLNVRKAKSDNARVWVSHSAKSEPPNLINPVPIAIRPLGSLEHLLWLMDQNRPIHFAEVALVTGPSTASEWHRALDHVQRRHPLLSVSIEGKPGGVPQFCHVPGAYIPLHVIAGDPATDWETQVEEELATPFDPTQAPLVRACLIMGSDSAAFILVAHHAIADALSLAYIIRDILKALMGFSLEPLFFPQSQEEMLDLTEVPGADWGASKSVANEQEPYRFPIASTPRINHLRLPSDLMSRLKDRARREETTVHGALCAALVIAGREMSMSWRGNPVQVLTPIETRTALDADEGCGIYLSAVTTLFETEVKNFWDLARQSRAETAAAKTHDGIVEVASSIKRVVDGGLDVAAAAQFTDLAFEHDAMLSNLGAVPFSGQFGRLKLEALWGPIVTSGQAETQSIGALSLDGGLFLVQTSRRPVEGLLGAMLMALMRACSNGARFEFAETTGSGVSA